VLVAHSLGCQLVAAWAAHTRHPERVRAALLVAPPDVEREDMPPHLAPWRPIVRKRLPFRSTAVVSRNDPYCAPDRAAAMAAQWGSEFVRLGDLGHINGSSGLADWPEGRALLQALIEASA
jgi:predicted alpha/beta hydrolase family esterase